MLRKCLSHTSAFFAENSKFDVSTRGISNIHFLWGASSLGNLKEAAWTFHDCSYFIKLVCNISNASYALKTAITDPTQLCKQCNLAYHASCYWQSYGKHGTGLTAALFWCEERSLIQALIVRWRSWQIREIEGPLRYIAYLVRLLTLGNNAQGKYL